MSEFENAPPSSILGAGRMLSKLREERGLSLSDVGQQLKYGVKQIEALEAEEFGRLPGPTFVRGMVRSYAKLLDTDPRAVLSALDRQYVPNEIDLDLRHKGVPFARTGKRATRTYLILSVLVFIAAGIFYEWRAGAFPWARWVPNPSPPLQEPGVGAAAPPAAQASPQSVAPSPEATRSAAASAATETTATSVPAPQPSEGRIRLEFEGESWVEIREQDGKMLMSQLNSAGSRKVVVGHPPMSLVIGNAAAVRLTYNDRVVDLKPHIEIEVARLTLE